MKGATSAGWMVALLVLACLVSCASRPIEVYEYVLVAAATAAPSGNATRELAIGVGRRAAPPHASGIGRSAPTSCAHP
jgi:hypothetical protein